jgi:hypothetical protein
MLSILDGRVIDCIQQLSKVQAPRTLNRESHANLIVGRRLQEKKQNGLREISDDGMQIDENREHSPNA